MENIQIFLGNGFISSVSLFYGFVSIIFLSVKWLIKGKDFWKVKPRPVAPSCLQNPAYGKHSFIRLGNGLKYHYVENGNKSKPLILFVHGFPEFWFTWRYQLEYFSKNYWVVAFDMRGYGDSDKPKEVSAYKTSILEQDIHDMVKALGRDNCVLVAHDWGGLLAWTLAANYPNLVKKLIILNAPHPACLSLKVATIGQFFKSWYIFYFQLPYLPELGVRAQDLEFIQELLGKTISPEELEAYKYTFSQDGALSGPINYYRNTLNAKDLLNPVKYPKIRIPTLLIWGENDPFLGKNLAELCKNEVTNLKIEYIPDGNHFINQHKPNEVNRLMDTFLSKV